MNIYIKKIKKNISDKKGELNKRLGKNLSEKDGITRGRRRRQHAHA